MKKLLFALLISLCPSVYAAINGGAVYEYRSGSDNNNGGGFVWLPLSSTGAVNVATSYTWTASTSGTNEYYVQTATGGSPNVVLTGSVTVDGNFNAAAMGTVGSLAAGQYGFADNSNLGYQTMYVRLVSSSSPNNVDPFTVCIASGGGADYSQQASPKYALTGITAIGPGNTFAYGSASLDMVGNILNVVSGSGFVPGRYQIISVVPNVSVTVDSAVCTGIGISGVINIGGALAVPTDAIWETNGAGNRNYIKNDGAYTLTGTISIARNGLVQAPIVVEGYNLTRGDTPTGINRPAIACAANTFAFGNYWIIKNLTLTGTANGVISIPAGTIQNCKAINSSVTAAKVAFSWTTGSYPAYVKNEGVSYNGSAFFLYSTSFMLDNYAHDSQIGFNFGTVGLDTLIGSISNECSTGTTGANFISCKFINNIFHKSDNASGSYAVTFSPNATGEFAYFYNNVFDGFQTALQWSHYTPFVTFFNNDFYNNTTTATLVQNLNNSNSVYTNPQFVNPNGTMIFNCETPFNEQVISNVTVGTDTTNHKLGTYSSSCTVAAAFTTGVVASKALTSTNMSNYGGVRFWARSSVTLAAGDWQLLLDDSANCASPVLTLNIPAMTANTNYQFYLDGGNMSAATAIISIGLKQAVDKGAMIFQIDDIHGADCDFRVAAGSPLLGTGYDIGATEGLVTGTDMKWNIGVDQGDHSTTTSGSGGSWTFVQ
jgi:hypothetical protein